MVLDVLEFVEVIRLGRKVERLLFRGGREILYLKDGDWILIE